LGPDDIFEIHPGQPQKGQLVAIVVNGERKIGICRGRYIELVNGLSVLIETSEILGIVRQLSSV